MTSKEPYTAAAGQVRKATEQSADAWKAGAKKLLDQAGTNSAMPQVDLNQPVEQYFDFVQRTVDMNRELATKWAELVNTLSGGARKRAKSFSRLVQDQADTLAGMAAEQAQKTEQAAREQAEQAEQAVKEQADEAERVKRERAEQAEQAEKAKAREAKRIEREKAKKAQQHAREAYEGLTKAELSGQLAGRGLPKTGNVGHLIERLVSADPA